MDPHDLASPEPKWPGSSLLGNCFWLRSSRKRYECFIESSSSRWNQEKARVHFTPSFFTYHHCPIVNKTRTTFLNNKTKKHSERLFSSSRTKCFRGPCTSKVVHKFGDRKKSPSFHQDKSSKKKGNFYLAR